MGKLVDDMRGNRQQNVSVIVKFNPNEHDFQKQSFRNILQNRYS